LNRSNNKTVKALIELPTWLGDCVMTTPAIENISNYFNEVEITIFGSKTSVELIKNHPKVINSLVIDSKNQFSLRTYTNLGSFDFFFSFRGSIKAKIIKLIVNAKNKYQFDHKKNSNCHQVIKYTDFINLSLNVNLHAGNLVSYFERPNITKVSRILGINPGASYGDAKRWYPEKFMQIALELSDSFDIIIFGGINELEFAKKIEDHLIKNNIKNFSNLAGKTSIAELTKYISSLDIFITGDSGPMHIAASLQIPTIALFGPTNPTETSQWNNPDSQIVKKNLDCQPCMKRTCPLKHHNCMKLIEPRDVIDSVSRIIKI
jgi:heptosyltransferase II